MPNLFKRRLLVGSAIIGGSLLFFSLALFLLSGDLESRAGKVSADRALVSKGAAAISVLANLKKGAPQTVPYKQAIDKILVSQDQLLNFPKWLEGLSRTRRIALAFAFQGGQVASRGDLPAYIPFSVDLGGRLDDLKDFIEDIEFREPKFLLTLDSLDLTRKGADYRIVSQGRVFFK